MPVGTSFQVEGLRELHEQFANLDKSLRRGMQRKAMRAAVKPVVAAAKRHARRRTGEGAKSIRGSIRANGMTAEGRIGFSKERFYMRFHETGTRKMPARPFLRPALDEQAAAAVDAYKVRMAALVEEATRTVVDGEGEEDVT